MAVIAPARTPVPIINKPNAEMIKVFKRPDVQARLTEMGAEYLGSTPQAELNKQLANDVRGWGEVGGRRRGRAGGGKIVSTTR